MKKAFFLDRDGVINADHGYVSQPEDFEFLPGVFEACCAIKAAGYLLVIVTNQAGIARGYYTEDDFHALTSWMRDQFRREGIDIDAIHYCPHHPTEGLAHYKQQCDCRKPAPGMLLEAAQRLNIDLAASVMVGDKPSDMEAGRRAGVPQLYAIEGGYALNKDDGVARFPSLLAITQHLFGAGPRQD
ncbi:D-glycero-beta-D-manno-heptose 1,7-bisphosphate 7-phosphatase [Alteromonas halophila]|nr:D-glycero-beta-D-manno-heptose 1,7-bisphosphate 7-phosphatase [Alteromonas halophila]